MYPDVAVGTTSSEQTGWDHYNGFGRHENRRLCDVDDEFYLHAYALAGDEIRAGLAADPYDHYVRLGFARGYLPFRSARRPSNAASLPSPFGGLWPDLANASDIIEGKLEVGQITPRQAELLRFWTENGYVILEKAVPDDIIDRATTDLEKAYAGEFPMLLFECHSVARHLIKWQPEINACPAKVLDLHHFSPAVRELMFSGAIAEFLGLIFESKAFASQTLGFLRGSAQEGHQDSAYVPYSISRQFAATWIALEDVTIGAGELFYYPGSHRFPDFLYSNEFKSTHEAIRSGRTEALSEEVPGHVRGLEAQARWYGIEKKPFAAKKGDVLVWHADLVHGGNPVSREVTRKSIVTHYCPKRLVPLGVEHGATRSWDHDGHRFTNGYYGEAGFVA
jgi:ectoine hydroxylase-related dioxygenase (phytanoyl-CoA dioxygenase family)